MDFYLEWHVFGAIPVRKKKENVDLGRDSSYFRPRLFTARDENPGKLLILPSAPPLLSPFVPFWVLFGAPAMNWDHTVSWGRGVWVSVSDIGRVGQPELVVSQPELKKNRKRVSCCLL